MAYVSAENDGTITVVDAKRHSRSHHQTAGRDDATGGHGRLT
jgi:hypothetical protein